MTLSRPVALIILDGYGLCPDCEGNAVTRAHTPFLDRLFQEHPHTRLACFGEAVGLPEGQMGNSEVGHLNLGAGRVVYQDITRINQAVRRGELADNPALNLVFSRLAATGGALHFLGLLSDGGVHSLQAHLEALVDLALDRGLSRVFIHAFLDGRDTPPDSGAGYLRQLQEFLATRPQARVATVTGRFWAMDRDKRWDRVARAYAALVRGEGKLASDPVAAVEESYALGKEDEFVEPIVLTQDDGRPRGLLADGDAVVFFNFRADRARELSWAFNSPDFSGFDVADRPKLAAWACMTSYSEDLDVPVLFPPQELDQTLAEVVSQAGLHQLHIAETEKYAHVTFFFNGGEEKPFPGEDRVLIPSPSDVTTYDEKPEMSAPAVSDEVIARAQTGLYDLIVMNYANGDMVGHTGIYPAALKAVETLDQSLARVVPALQTAGYRVLITADHGNAEQMLNDEGTGPYTAHTVSNPVPLIMLDGAGPPCNLAHGALCDVAPTVLALMGLPQPARMTGRDLREI